MRVASWIVIVYQLSHQLAWTYWNCALAQLCGLSEIMLSLIS